MRELFSVRAHPGFDRLFCRVLEENDVPHGFTLRTQGFGERDHGHEDRQRLVNALGLESATHMRQVHGNTVRLVRTNDTIPEADGLLTDEPGLGLIVHSADCLPLLFWSEATNAVAAVHAGWRGTLARVATTAVRTLTRELGVEPHQTHVAIGPAIRACCFEVGDEVVEAFAESGRNVSAITHDGPRGRKHIDLVADNRMQLEEAGVAADRIYDCCRCTSCENERFHSYRRQGELVGRVISIVGIRSRAR
ncbi:MAG TPA: peptidoglycan editing factor PgeF [Vicinamibacteria bacterium]|nr:peptidoglycan editing factor PgeF [Vicinamibacteria bacterium]